MGNYGCAGGSLRNTLKYLDQNGGLMISADYPYSGKVIYEINLYMYLYHYILQQTKCKFNIQKSVVNISYWAILPPRDEKTLQAAIVKIGPLAVSINASPHTFQLYQ